MLSKMFVSVSDVQGNSIRLNLQHISSFQFTATGAIVTTVDGQKIQLPPEEAGKLAPHVNAATRL